MKKLLLVSALICTPAAMAHNDNDSAISFSSDECNVEFKNDVRIKPNELEIFTANNKTMLFNTHGDLTVNGEFVALNNSQREALTKYSDSLRTQLPEVANIALEGVKIAGVALEEVGNAFNIDGLDNMSELMDDIKIEVENTFYQQGTFVMGQQSFNQFGENFEQQFEQQIETAVESAVMQSMGSILVALGSELLGSGGDMDAFEQRMENMGAQIEEKVELHASALEERANSLCGNFADIAKQEEQLVMQVPELEGYQLFSFKQN
ncbi:YggN family protein [Pseudoalteromonas sp. SCSIO 43210]